MDSNAILAAIIMARNLEDLLGTYTLNEIERVFDLDYPHLREPGCPVPNEVIWAELRSLAQDELTKMFTSFRSR